LFVVERLPVLYTIYYMANVTIYLPEEVEGRIRKAAKAEGTSVSRWIAGQLTKIVDQGPANELVSLAGAFPDFPEIDELRHGYGTDTPREHVE
jgi:hypothetical protein